MDNRIFNNLKQQLNEMIESETSLIRMDEFRKIFFTYFKGEAKANLVYEKLLPFITVIDSDAESMSYASIDAEHAGYMVSIQKLTKFIDSFNFSPINVAHINYKNDSNEMTYVMTSNVKGSLA